MKYLLEKITQINIIRQSYSFRSVHMQTVKGFQFILGSLREVGFERAEQSKLEERFQGRIAPRHAQAYGQLLADGF